MRKICCVSVMLVFLLTGVVAHSGRTDANGGHWNRKTGTYHYHNGGKSSSGSTATTQSSNTRVTISDIGNYVFLIQDANLRKGPSSEYDVIRVIKKDSLVKIISIENTWAKIETLEPNDENAWISLSLLKK